MAKQSKKVQTKAKINWGWDAPEDRTGKAKRNLNKKSKTIKKLGIRAILIILLIGIIGCGMGVGACWALTRNDCFTIIGNDEVTLTLRDEGEDINLNNSYYDESVKIVSFGRDISNDVIVETNLKQYPNGNYYADEIGTYYIMYKVNDIKYGKIFTVQRIRLITFVESTPGNQVD